MDADRRPPTAARRTHAARHGHARARRGPTARCARCWRCARWGADAGAAYAGSAIRYPDRPAIDRRARHADLRARSTGAPTRSRASCATAGIGEGDGVAIMCRNHRGFIEATVACSKLGAERAVSEHGVRGAADHRRARARAGPWRSSTTRSSPSSSREGAAGRKRFVAWTRARTPAGAGADPRLEDLIAARRRLRPGAAGRAGSRRDPHLRHDRHAEGRRAQTAGLARAGRGAVLEDPAARARDDDDRRADVPLVGLRALHARRCRCPRRSCCAAASTPRRRCAAIAQHRATTLALVPVMLQRILELGPADDRALRPELRCG